MLSIADELKIIQQSTTEEERCRRAQQLQQRLQEDALRRKLRNVRLIGSVERLAERASSLRQLTDRLRLIKRQYEVLATHLPDNDPSSQSQLAESAAALRHSQSATSVGETEHHRQTALNAASGDPTAALSHLVEGYYDPRLAARGWQGAADPWGPSSQQLGRDELGRSTESRAALLRSRIATSVTVRSEPPAPPGGRGVNYAAVGGQTWERGRETEWDCAERGPGPGPRDPSDWDPEWDRSGPGERSSAPMQDRSVSEYSVSAPGRRRAAPLAWDGTLDGVASRWGTLERPTAADEQLHQLDSALARQRQLLAATAAATERAETAAAKSSEAMHEAGQTRRYEEDGARFERDPSGGGEGERMREIGEDDERAEMEAEEREMRKQESLRRREEEEEERRRSTLDGRPAICR
ncbi:hypothetical protein FJT64_009354 [Amphibalanus amphitrite]|uniref:Uncharacterized protein n=1 Tax=Amphibalanus amphitrite TaxID=1232801 RepID=A0A6A4VFG8_AMPAM|nr:hypothetical protein FJT64_009354 [Amphibalanus amphitrite]